MLSKFAFWDVDLKSLDLERYADFIIVRVFERGSIDDVNFIIAYYGRDRICKTLKETSPIMTRAVLLAIKMFGLSDADFIALRTNNPLNISKY